MVKALDTGRKLNVHKNIFDYPEQLGFCIRLSNLILSCANWTPYKSALCFYFYPFDHFDTLPSGFLAIGVVIASLFILKL